MKKRKKLGILGGMGPAATAYLFQKIVSATPARTDGDHIEIFVHNNVRVPDRIKAILSHGPSPAAEMIRSASLLKAMGADLAVVPCMTAHHFLPEVQREVDLPLINAIEETANEIQASFPEVTCCGVLATTGTITARVFQAALEKRGLKAIVPDSHHQRDCVMAAIYGERGIKAGCTGEHPLNLLRSAASGLVARGAEILIAGCTEIPLVLGREHSAVHYIDPLDILCRRAIALCRP